ncbi:MAG TPA: type II toxin-antitoxin system RelB/DinJ family antitoxin [Rhodothermales bacterium]|nr:type II toxin-antitoxin system RelB/DinJ family antitoxin [Rhodothermales bacterium]
MHTQSVTSLFAMNKTGTISARISARDKKAAEAVFKKLGITASQAIAMFYKQVQLRNGIPFPVELPNVATQSAVDEGRSGKGRSFTGTAELYEDLGI